MDLCPGNGPLSKSVPSEEWPLGALTTEGSISQAACVQERQEGGFLQKGICPCGLVYLGVWREVCLGCGWTKLLSPVEGDGVVQALS